MQFQIPLQLMPIRIVTKAYQLHYLLHTGNLFLFSVDIAIDYHYDPHKLEIKFCMFLFPSKGHVVHLTESRAFFLVPCRFISYAYIFT